MVFHQWPLQSLNDLINLLFNFWIRRKSSPVIFGSYCKTLEKTDNKFYRHAVYACRKSPLTLPGHRIKWRYNNVSLTVNLPVNAKMLKEFMFNSI